MQPEQSQRFERLLVPELPNLRRFALRLERDPISAEDLLQQSIVTGLGRIAQLQADGAFRVWASRILFHTHLNRKKRKTEAVMDPQTLDNIVSLDMARRGPHRDYERAELSNQLGNALDTLPAPQRNALWLVDGQGFSFSEAAKVLDIPIGTAASRVGRARIAMRTALQTVAQQMGVIQ